MKTINNYILEKLRINKETKVESLEEYKGIGIKLSSDSDWNTKNVKDFIDCFTEEQLKAVSDITFTDIKDDGYSFVIFHFNGHFSTTNDVYKLLCTYLGYFRASREVLKMYQTTKGGVEFSCFQNPNTKSWDKIRFYTKIKDNKVTFKP